MNTILPFIAPYLELMDRYIVCSDGMEREVVLVEAGELGKRALAEGCSADQIIELHGRTQATLAARWRGAAPGSPGEAALHRLAAGDALPLMVAVSLPQQLAQLAHHERRWRREHDTLHALFGQTDDMIVVLDAAGQIDDVNPAFTRMTGWAPLEAASMSSAMWRVALPGQATEHVRAEQSRRDGSTFMAEWSVSPILGRDGQLISHVCIGRDITRQQQIEDGLRENDKLRAVATLAGGIAHDFNNLLGSILGLAELCELEAAPGSRQARNLGRIRQAGGRAAVLVRQMLDFSRQTPRSARRLPMGELLQHAAGLLAAALPPQVTLDTCVEGDGLVVMDLVQMEQVLLNMVRNAADAMRGYGGVVRLVLDRADPGTPATAAAPASPPPSHMRLRIVDTGTGIDPRVLPKIFEPFFTTKPVGQGTGLGLAAVHGIVTSHDGSVEVASLPGAGTTFSIFLPLADPQVGAAAAEEPDEPGALQAPTFPESLEVQQAPPGHPQAQLR